MPHLQHMIWNSEQACTFSFLDFFPKWMAAGPGSIRKKAKMYADIYEQYEGILLY